MMTLAAVRSVETAPGVEQIVLVDSGSSQADLAILQRGLSSTRIHTGAFKNAAAARNAALSHVETDLIGFLDSDDLMRPEKTTCLEPILRRDHKTVLVVGRTEVVDKSGLPFRVMQSVHDAGYKVERWTARAVTP
jgi:glycosyltransferase involved in cell wall biosynthesis